MQFTMQSDLELSLTSNSNRDVVTWRTELEMQIKKPSLPEIFLNSQQKGKVTSEELQVFPSSRKITHGVLFNNKGQKKCIPTVELYLPVSYNLIYVLALYAVFSLHTDKPWDELLKKVQLLKNLELGISKNVVQNCK